MAIAYVDQKKRIVVPENLTSLLKPGSKMEVKKEGDKLVFSPIRTWDEIFTKKLRMRRKNIVDLSETSLDDVWS